VFVTAGVFSIRFFVVSIGDLSSVRNSTGSPRSIFEKLNFLLTSVLSRNLRDLGFGWGREIEPKIAKNYC